jgi:alginate O-acetyltransferase complex protein AlgJ
MSTSKIGCVQQLREARIIPLAPQNRGASIITTMFSAKSGHRFTEDAVTALLFLVTIFFFGAATWIIQPSLNMPLEYRFRAPLPHLNFHRVITEMAMPSHFSSEFQSYFGDRLALRTELIRCKSLLSYFLLHETGTKDAIVGNAGWFFMAKEHVLESFCNARPFTATELAQVANDLQGRQDWLAERNIHYLFVIAPDAPTIYPEYVPSQFRKLNPQSRWDQLLTYLKIHSTVNVLDLRPALLKAKARGRIYFKTDPHWNDLGAFIAYQQIAEYLSRWYPSIQPLRLLEMRKETRLFKDGEFATWLGMNDLLSEPSPHLLPLRKQLFSASRVLPGEAPPIDGPYGDEAVFATAISDPQLPKAIMLRDSFAKNLQPFLSEHFRRILYLWHFGFPTQIIEQERPDVVIEEKVERNLMNYNGPS